MMRRFLNHRTASLTCLLCRCQSSASSEKEQSATSDATSSGITEAAAPSDISPRSEGFIRPSNDVVLEYARGALAREGRDQEPKAEVYAFDTTTYPILAKGRKNYYERTDDIPTYVTPYYEHQYLQTREYFQRQRERKPLLQRLKPIVGWGLVMGLVYGFVSITSVWVAQPNDLKLLREGLLQHSYGRVCELGAGHGMNIGQYPYPVHEIVMTDTNKNQLNHLRYRIPKTAYPKYDVRLVDSEQLTVFADGEFDCVIDMFGICHLNDPVMALRQMQRIVKPTGLILLLEHGRSKYPWVNWFLDYYSDKHEINTHGCQWNMPIADFVKESKLQVKEMRNMHYGTTYYVVAFPEVLPESKMAISA
jgi:methyltransferase OMS1